MEKGRDKSRKRKRNREGSQGGVDKGSEQKVITIMTFRAITKRKVLFTDVSNRNIANISEIIVEIYNSCLFQIKHKGSPRFNLKIVWVGVNKLKLG